MPVRTKERGCQLCSSADLLQSSALRTPSERCHWALEMLQPIYSAFFLNSACPQLSVCYSVCHIGIFTCWLFSSATGFILEVVF